jgi:CheY-like chemotaxis protein
MTPLADAAGVTLTDVPASAEYSVFADRQRLRQILLNLLSNAIKYNQPGGSVWVDQRVVEQQVEITVHDDGQGIPAALQARLFTPFDRLGAEASAVDGTGIGLVLARALAELMDGSIAVDSVLGRGSAFSVSLPRALAPPRSRAIDAGPEAHDATSIAAEDLPAGSRTLLYIEDNEPNVRVVAHVLKLRPEWTMVHTPLARRGVEMARTLQPDLVLLDLHLPDGSGAEVLQRLKADPVMTALPVVILTADAKSGQSRRLLDMGAGLYLTKPLDVRDLLALLDETAARIG